MRDAGNARYHVLDFTLQRRSDDVRLVTEMKCEIEWGNFAYLE